MRGTFCAPASGHRSSVLTRAAADLTKWATFTMNQISRRSFLAIGSAAVTVAALPSQAAFAQASSSSTPATDEGVDETIWFIIAPEGKGNAEIFEVELAPGEAATLSGVFGNGSEIPVDAVMYKADLNHPVNGGFALKNAEAPINEPTTWIDFPTESVSFAAQDVRQRTFTVSVPVDAQPGQYITGLAIEMAEAITPPGGLTLPVKYRLINAIIITVPGEITPAFSIADLSLTVDGSATTIGGTISNTGNVRVRPAGPITVSKEDGTVLLSTDFAMQSVFGGYSAPFQASAAVVVPIEELKVHVELSDNDTGATAEIEHVVLPVDLTATQSPISITAIEINPMPSAEDLVFTQMKVTITNTGQPVTGIELEVYVARDDNVIDQAVLASALSIGAGDSIVDQPYIPESGTWDPGTYQFEFVLSSVNPQSGARTEIDRVSPTGTIEVE